MDLHGYPCDCLTYSMGFLLYYLYCSLRISRYSQHQYKYLTCFFPLWGGHWTSRQLCSSVGPSPQGACHDKRMKKEGYVRLKPSNMSQIRTYQMYMWQTNKRSWINFIPRWIYMIKSLQSTNWSGWIEGMDHHFVKPFPKCKELYQIEFPHMLVAWWNPCCRNTIIPYYLYLAS